MTSTGAFLKRAARWLRDWAPYLAMAVPVLVAIHFVWVYGVNVIWEDQWNGMLPLFEKWYAGTLGLGDFWAQHNEHRHFFPRLLMFALGLATRWNVLVEMFVSQFFLLAALLTFLAVLRRECRSRNHRWWMVPIAFLVFSLREHQTLLFGMMICFTLTMAATAAAFFFLYLLNNAQWLKLKFAAAVAAATVATYSAGFGLLVWPAGLVPLLWLSLDKRKRLTLAALWTAMAIVEWAAYFWRYTRLADDPAVAPSWEHFATIVGGALFPTIIPAIVGGVMILLLVAISAVLAIRSGSGSRYSFWLAAIAFGLLTQTLTTVGRSGLGADQALASRYATFSLFVVIGLYGILSGLCDEKPSPFHFALWGNLFSLVVLGVAFSAVDGYEMGAKLNGLQQYQAFVFCTCQSQPDGALSTSPGVSPAVVRRGIEFLQQHHWNLFASDAFAARYAMRDTSLPTLPVAARVAINQPQVDKDSGRITVAGWAVDRTTNDAVGGVYLEFDGVSYPAYYGWDRSDVTEMLKDIPVRCCGFLRSFSAEQLAAGRHRLIIWVLTKDRTAFYAYSGPLNFGVGR